MRIDLKWSLWSEDLSLFPSEVIAVMRTAFQGGPPVTIYTAPRKEIRFGVVEISKGSARVDFHTEWDPIECLVDSEADRDAAYSYFDEFSDDSPVGARITRTVKARSFKQVMRLIDACESDLIAEDERAYKAFGEFIGGDL